ncbi:hypothetical protein ASF69_18015 [Rhizobium sp. Leaf311]|nr:hypothetical protein ASF69_18015 [Rhizobium sp. Leaf311]
MNRKIFINIFTWRHYSAMVFSDQFPLWYSRWEVKRDDRNGKTQAMTIVFCFDQVRARWQVNEVELALRGM